MLRNEFANFGRCENQSNKKKARRRPDGQKAHNNDIAMTKNNRLGLFCDAFFVDYNVDKFLGNIQVINYWLGNY